MKKAAILYQSRYGSTKRYAQWIAEESGADCIESSRVMPDQLANYDTLVFGGGLYAGGISGASVLTKNFTQLKEKNLAVFTVGLANPSDPSIFQEATEKNFTPEMRERIRFFHLRGGMDYQALSPVHRAMMFTMKCIVQRQKEKTEENGQFLETYGKAVDFCDQSTVKPIVDFLKCPSQTF